MNEYKNKQTNMNEWMNTKIGNANELIVLIMKQNGTEVGIAVVGAGEKSKIFIHSFIHVFFVYVCFLNSFLSLFFFYLRT